MNYLKKLGFLLLAAALLFSGMSFNLAASASELDSADSAKYEENVKKSNDMVFHFWDYYADYEAEVFSSPTYFSGFHLNTDGTLLMYVTDDSKAVKATVFDICESTDLSFQTMKYSYSELVALREELSKYSDLYNIKCTSLSLHSNKVIVYTNGDPAEVKALIHSTFKGESLGIQSVDEMIEVEKYAPPETAMPDHSASAQVSNIRGQNSITPMTQVNETFYPGELSTLESNDTGTIGFCATDSYGRKLLITHGHGHGQHEPTVTVGGHTLNVYPLGSFLTVDAAYIVLPLYDPDFYPVLTNRVNNTSTTINTIAYDYLLETYEGLPVQIFGQTSSFFITTIDYILNENGFWFLAVDTPYPQDGDSGGPVYMTGTQNNRLIGIVSSEYGDVIIWKMIREEYYNVTGFTLTPWVS